jgi:hypothetical protein
LDKKKNKGGLNMCALRLSTGLRTGLASTSGLKDMLEGGFLDVYSGGQPSGADLAETGVKLARISKASGTDGLLFGTAGAGILPKGGEVWSGLILVAGVAGYFRLYGTAGTSGSSASEKRMDGNVGVSGSDLVLANTSLVKDATLTIDTFSLEVPSA